MINVDYIDGDVIIDIDHEKLGKFLEKNSATSFDNYLRQISNSVHQKYSVVNPPSEDTVYFI
jgi:hypothetical protein